MAGFRDTIPIYGAALTLLAGLAGCVQMAQLPNPFHQVTPDEQLEKALDIGTIGDFTEVNNGGVIPVFGVGLVVGLDGTGGTSRGDYRAMLAQQLRAQKVDNTEAVLDDPNNALVLVKALIPAGVRRSELFDVEVSLPDDSRATSLKGGILAPCPLFNFEDAKNISPEKSSSFLKGHKLAKAAGPLLVGLGNLEDEHALRRARVWSGASSLIERPFEFVLTKEGMTKAEFGNSIANRLNQKFQDAPRKKEFVALEQVTQQIKNTFEGGFNKSDMAKATNKKSVSVRVPYAYRFNHERFLLVSRLVPLSAPPDVMNNYRRKLDSILLDPKHTMRAALRLEALGKDSVPILRKGLGSPDALVRFSSAESLAYLNSTEGIEDLAKLAIQHADLRAYALIAIAGLDESICRQKLGELMTIDDPELRCGAFRALAMLDENDPRLAGEQMGPFTLHRVVIGSAPLVTFGTSKRPEIVLFGPDVMMKTPLKAWAAGGEFTVTADPNDDRITVSHITVKGLHRKQCALTLDETLRSMVELGAGYPDVVDLLKNLHDEHLLACPIRELKTPEAVGLETIRQTGLKEARVPFVD